MTPLPFPTPSSNAAGTDQSVTVKGGGRIVVDPDPQLDPILICTVEPRNASTLLRALRAYRRSYSGVADEANRADRWISALERALDIYWGWIEERRHAVEKGHLQGHPGAEHQGDD